MYACLYVRVCVCVGSGWKRFICDINWKTQKMNNIQTYATLQVQVVCSSEMCVLEFASVF